MLRQFVSLLLAMALIASGAGCSRNGNQGLRFGAILPLTGDAAPYGSSLKRGMDLGIEQVNAQGGINGKKIEVIFEDDRNLPQDGVTAFNKLKAIDNVPLVMGAMFSAVTLAIAPIAEKDRIVLLSPTSSDVSLTDAGDYIFRIYPSDSYDGSFLARFAFEGTGARKVAILSMQASSTVSVSRLFKKVFEATGGVVVSEDTFKEGTTDFRATLTKIKQRQQDLVFLPTALKEATLILRQARELGVSAKFLGISTLFDPKLVELAGEAANGVLFSSPVFDPASSTPEIHSFVEAYKRKYNVEPDILGAYGYDTVNIAAAAVRSIDGERVTSDGIKQSLYRIKGYRGVTGVMTFDTNGDVAKELRVMTVNNGKFVPYPGL